MLKIVNLAGRIRIILLVVLFILIKVSLISAQENDTLKELKMVISEIDTPDANIARNTIFLEFIGNGLTLGTINYEWLIKRKNWTTLYVRGGFFHVPTFIYKQENGDYSFPLSVITFSAIPTELTVSIGKKLSFDSGVGLNFWWNSNTDDPFYDSKILFTIRTLGLRYQKKEGGLWFRFSGIGVEYEFIRFKNEMLFGKFYNRAIAPIIGIGAGYSF